MDSPGEPMDGYDRMDAKDIVNSLSDRSQVELAAIDGYERANKERVAVLDKLRYMQQAEPIPGYDAMSTNEIFAALDAADLSAIKRVRAYERKFKDRREVLEEVARLHGERRIPLVSRDSA